MGSEQKPRGRLAETVGQCRELAVVAPVQV